VKNQNEDKLLSVFIDVVISEFRKSSAIHLKFLTRPDGSSVYDEVSRDPPAAIDRFTKGRSEKFIDILVAHVEDALIEWALEKMGEEGFKKRLESALADFWNRAFLNMAFNTKLDLLKFSRQGRLELPIQTPRSSSFPYDKIKEIAQTYDQALDAANIIKKHKGDPTALKFAIDKQWPDVTSATRGRYATMRPTQIAMDYTAWKHHPIGAELTKKILNRMRVRVKGKLLPFRYPQDLIDRQFRIVKKKQT